MSALVREVVGLLDLQTDLARQLVEALQADKQRIIQHEIDALEQSNRHKEELVLRLQSAERQRQDACVRLAQGLGLPAERAVVSALCERLGPEGEPLCDAADRLRAVIGSLRELVAVSHGFLEQSILGIRGLIGLIAAFRAREPGTYDATGRLASEGPNEPVALRQEV